MAALMSQGYRSVAEYCFPEEQTDAIVRAIAYHRKDYCHSVIWFSPREHVGIRWSITTSFQRTANTGLGSLNQLPLELLHDYQIVVSHGLNLLCALLRTRLAIGVSLFDFYDALCTKDCTLCGEFGGFISLLTWNRCYFTCLQGALETQVRTLTAVKKQFHLTKAQLDQLRSFKSLPGICSMEESVHKSRITLVSVHQAILVSGQQPHALPEAQPVDSGRNQKFNFMGSCALPYYDRRTDRVEHGMSCAGCQLALEKDIIGSGGEKWAFEARDKLLWSSSGEGNNRPTELPEAARRGGFFNSRE
ncbi:hypothetical protein F5B18DRAFT_652795 [Nemania serpens]|nr:hypothetical protein F5B18DRAFT_652795 [Nemania serpens]